MKYRIFSVRTAWGLGVASTVLGIMALLAVCAFHFPSYLTTPALRDFYEERWMRYLLLLGILTGYSFALLGTIFGSPLKYPVLGIIFLTLAITFGGASVPLEGDISRHTPYLSLDLVLLDLLYLTSFFIPLERLFKRNLAQAANRPHWRTDLLHYLVNHLLLGGISWIIYAPYSVITFRFELSSLQNFVASIHPVMQVMLIAIIGEFSQYAAHRMHHEIPFLWRFHRIHHSSEYLDWLASSRLHLVDVILTRTITLTPVLVLGFSQKLVHIWLLLLGFQSIFIHCNVRWKLLSLSPYFVTPIVHHWHHAKQKEAINMNYAISLSFVDRMFNSYYCPSFWPQRLGVADGPVPDGYLLQLIAPFRVKK